MAGTDTPLSEAERTSAVHCVRMICVDPDDNNNKFWHGLVLPDGTYVAEYGRVGDANRRTDRKAMSVASATDLVDKNVRKRENYKPPKKQPYVIQRTIEAGASAAPSKGRAVANTAVKSTAVQEISFGGNAELRKLITWLAEVNVHTITQNTNIAYDASSGTFSTPLGLVTPDGIDDARDQLIVIAKYTKKLEHPACRAAIKTYLQTVPQDVGRNRGWDKVLFGQTDSMQKQSDLLDSLAASIQQVQSAKPKDKNKKDAPAPKRVFDVELSLVEDKKVFDKVRRKFQADRGSHYDVRTLDLKRVFVVEISAVKAAFDADGAKIGNVMQLWHGTGAANLLSILKGGLVIPRSGASHVTGRMYGDGVYGSDQSTKSLRYATNAWGYSGDASRTFMFLCDFAMGRVHKPRSWGSNFPVAGSDSTFAEAGKSGVGNNEMIVYRTSQVNLIFLCEFTDGGR